MRAIKNYSEEQAQELLTYINQELGYVYLPNESIINRYIHWYVPVINGFEYLFPEKVLKREENIDLNTFELTGNPNVDTNFNLGVSIKANVIDISNNNLSTQVVDTEINNVITNFNGFNTDEDQHVYVHIGGNNDLPLYANSTPSQSIIDSIVSFAETNNVHVTYWDGSKNVSLPTDKIQISTTEDYVITKVSSIDRGVAIINDMPENENVFFVTKFIFERFALLMNGQKYGESSYKVFVTFDNNLDIKDVFDQSSNISEVNLNDVNLVYAPWDFFMTAIHLNELGDPDLTVWNSYLSRNEVEQEKQTRLFPQIDLSLLE